MVFVLNWTGTAIDNEVVSFEVAQAEGDFATLTITVRNPRVGLLAGNLWATLSSDGDPLFYGRLIGLPQDMQGELVSLQFIARPDSYDQDKIDAAADLKLPPFWDPLFVPVDRKDDPDFVLESRPALWHIDPVTHEVTISDIIQGEAGTTVVPIAFYDSVKVSVGEQPSTKIKVHAEIRWTQAAKGALDMTHAIWLRFKRHEYGDSTNGPCLTTLTGGGLYKSWPKFGDNIGGGWTVGETFMERADGAGLPTAILTVSVGTGAFEGNTGVPHKGGGLLDRVYYDVVVVDSEGTPIPAGASISFDDNGEMVVTPLPASYDSTLTVRGFTPARPNFYKTDPTFPGVEGLAGFPIWSLSAGLKAAYDVGRERSEIVDFTLTSTVQPLASERGDNVLTFDLSGQVDLPLDPPEEEGGPMLMPIRDVRRKTYMQTKRGKQSLEYMICTARARLLATARAVRVSFSTKFDVARALSLRHSATLQDPRLPGGQATGKVCGYAYGLDGSSGLLSGSITLACTVGTGAGLTVPTSDPTAIFVDANYAVAGAIAATTAQEIAGDVSYIPIDDVELDDDGIDLTNILAELTEDQPGGVKGGVIKHLTVTFPYTEQRTHMQSFESTNAAVNALREIPTRVSLDLLPLVRNEPFVTLFPITVGELSVPKTIDLSAPSTP